MFNPCYKCGFCCTQGPCGYGLWNKTLKRCEYLEEPNENKQRYCKIYNEIIVFEKDAGLPMMGHGCSSSMFNGIRQAVIDKLQEKTNLKK